MTEVSKTSNKDNASSIAEFKKGKIVFKQKPLSFELFSETMQEIVEFRAYTQSLNSPLSVVPQDYFPLIAKLVQESDKSLSTLTKSLLFLLFPANPASQDLSDIAVLTQAVEEAIKNVAERVNYGISYELQKPPPSCAVWRWEVKDFGWLPESIRETALTRLTERKQANKVLQLCFDNFSEQEKRSILGKKPVQEASITMKEKPDKKPLRVVKEKRETESTKRSATAFANYFLKAKAVPQTDSSEATSAKISNDFENTFKPFLVKKSVRISPTNWFTISRRNRDCDIVEEEGNLVEVCRNNGKNVSKHWLSGSLSSYFPPDTPSLHPVGKTLSARRQFRKENQHSVRSIVNQSNEAELQGDQNNVRKYLAILKNRKLIPVKVLVFSENNRPGYLGTWTKASVTIGPRMPFALDLETLDYDYDSDAEWEVDESGEDVDSEEDSIEGDSASTASDLDHWLVDNDEIIENSAKSFNVEDKKRKAIDMDEEKSHNKRRRVVPLVPFTKGPIHETFLGVCEYDLFKRMRIQMFNDSPVPLNPFNFVPSITIERTEALSHNMINQQSTNISQLANNKQTAIPKTNFPDAHIEALLRKAVTINTSSLAVLVDVIYQDLRSLGIKKNALELKIREVLEKHKETKLWKVKESAWIRYGLTKPQASMS